ncbi:hypothetical protein BHM03_00009067 [Ensete ventricosum]|nr:hypothetical protein BHM03_00009067 [Ensete ventricosum]
MFRAKNKELKSGTGLEAVAAVEKRAIELNAKVEQFKAALEESEQRCKDHELATDSARGELKNLLELEKMGQVTYEFGYRVALEHFHTKYPDLSVEEDPFVKLPKDANVQLEVSQPFNDED